MAVATAPKEPAHIKLYNLPQRTEHGIRVYSQDRKRVYIFDHMDGMYANCQIEGTDAFMGLHAATPLVELGNDEYQIEGEADVHEEDEPTHADTATA